MDRIPVKMFFNQACEGVCSIGSDYARWKNCEKDQQELKDKLSYSLAGRAVGITATAIGVSSFLYCGIGPILSNLGTCLKTTGALWGGLAATELGVELFFASHRFKNETSNKSFKNCVMERGLCKYISNKLGLKQPQTRSPRGQKKAE